MIQIANPIYDSVFKYMMQNNKVCIILLGALLNKDIVEVEIVNNEIIRADLKKFAVLRLDFLAKIKNPDGTFEMVSIELQKAEKTTEIVRFRSYLASLYDTRANDVQIVERKNRKGDIKVEKKTPYHIVAIYILGHALDGIDEPVIYNGANPVGPTGKPIKNALSNPFFSSLTHDTIIVQIPRLRKNVQSRVEQFLDIFDQSRVMPKNEHYLLIDNIDDKPEGYETVVRQLAGAAADKQTKTEMDFEDEYAEDIEDRIELEEMLAETKEQLARKDEQLSQKDEQLSQKDEQLSQKDEQLSQKDEQLSQKDEQLSQKDEQLSQKDALITMLIKSMLSDGKTIESISKTLGLTEKQIAELLGR